MRMLLEKFTFFFYSKRINSLYKEIIYFSMAFNKPFIIFVLLRQKKNVRKTLNENQPGYFSLNFYQLCRHIVRKKLQYKLLSRR